MASTRRCIQGLNHYVVNLKLYHSVYTNMNLSKTIFFNFYLFMIVTEREREAETQAERSRLHAQGARRGNRSWVSRIVP